MSKPHVAWGAARRNVYNTRELFIEGRSIGLFDSFQEDASQHSIDTVLKALHEQGLIMYDGLPE